MAAPRPFQGLRLGQRQEMSLLPQMLQAVEVLQLPTTELQGFLLEAFEGNEALCLEEGLTDPTELAPPGASGARGGGDDGEGRDAWLQNQPAGAPSLPEVVEEQLSVIDVEPGLLPWVRLVVGALDDNGYLSTPDEALLEQAREAGLVEEGETGDRDLGRAIALVQGLEPRGIGGRNAVEALLLQLDPGDGDYALLCMLLEDFLEELAKNKLPAVAKAMGLDVDRVQELLERLKELDPRPAAGLAGEASPRLHPEVIVERTAEGFEVRIDQSGLPPLAIDPDVRALSRDRDLSKEVRQRLRGSLDQARWLLQALEQRKDTLQRVATTLFAHQTPFLEHGPGHLLPLRMNQVAEWLGVHTSTVSRAVSGKVAQTPWGIHPLRWFFQSGADDVARTDVREMVRSVIDAEDPSAPLSDDEIVAALAERGTKVARRTVAKYRQELSIPSSYRRRRHTA